MASLNKPRIFLSRRTALASAIATVGLVGATGALADPYPVNLTVVDRATGRPLRVWRHRGRLFVAGEPGERYSLRVSNRTGGRVLAVLSVDGVNILTGETASYDQRGYVFDPYESYDLTGWRKTLTEVAGFSFAPLPQSYAARTGRPGDVGVIGMAIFKEKPAPPPMEDAPSLQPRYVDREPAPAPAARLAEAPPPPPPPPEVVADAAKAAPRAPSSESVTGGIAQRSDEKLGTAHGARERSVTHLVSFERATSYPQSVLQIEYDTYANLAAAGVIPSPEPGRHPQPFPESQDGRGFVPDPPQEP
jgi:hypothetical protein